MKRILFAALLIESFVSESVLKAKQDFSVKDVEVDKNCEISAKGGDHLLFEYEFSYANGSELDNVVSSTRKPNQLFHLILVSVEDSPKFRDGFSAFDIHLYFRRAQVIVTFMLV